jgi:hypothetical protein
MGNGVTYAALTEAYEDEFKEKLPDKYMQLQTTM